MSTVPMQVRIDADVKKKASVIFDDLGLDISSAVNIFLHQCVLNGGIPFNVELPKFNKKTLSAIEEGRKIARDKKVKSYTNMKDLIKALNE